MKTKIKQETRGGKRKGAGRKPLPDSHKKTVRKLYQWTPEQYARIQEAVKASGKKEAEIVQEGTFQLVESILTEV